MSLKPLDLCFVRKEGIAYAQILNADSVIEGSSERDASRYSCAVSYEGFIQYIASAIC
jgi:hypothetical protein